VTWVDRLIWGLNNQKLEQFNSVSKWNTSILAYEVITNVPETLSDDYLNNVKQRILENKTTAQDQLYAKELYKRANNGKIDSKSAGVIYLRIDESGTLKPYIGQAESEDRFNARQQEHSRDNPKAKFKFVILDRGVPGLDLDRREQKAIDFFGGPSRSSTPNNPLSNKRDQIKK